MKCPWTGSLFYGPLVCAALCGCGRSTKPPVAEALPITGTVTMDGRPLSGAEVVYMCFDPTAAFAGGTKDDGTYQLQGPAGKATCKGNCKVTISRMLKPDGSPVAPGEPPAISMAVESLPEKYSSPNATELSADVPEAGGKFDFALTSK